jgi:hypothetical protein
MPNPSLRHPPNSMNEIKFSCSQCGQHILCDPLWSGSEINCPACQQTVVVPPPAPPAPPIAELMPTTPPTAGASPLSAPARKVSAPPPPQPVAAVPGRNAGFGAASRPKTYLMEAIVATLLCCIPFGIVAIVYAAQVDSKFSAGDYQGAQKAAHSAKTWYHVALISGLVIIAISITSKIATSN